MTCAVLLCVHAGRKEPQDGMHGGKKTKTRTKPHSASGGRQAQSQRAAGERDGAKGQKRDRGWREKKSNKEQKQQRRVTGWRKDTGNGGRGGQEEGPTTGPEGSAPHKRKGAGRGRPVLGTRTGPGKDADPVGPRHRVAGGPVQKKNGMQGKGDGTDKGVWLEPQDGPKRLGRRGKQGKGRGE